jgi:hypothetical protein
MTAKADNNSGGQQWHARLGHGLRRGWTRAGGERWQRYEVAMMTAVVDHGGGGRRRWRRTMTATADNDSGGGRLRRTTTALKIRRRNTRGKEENRGQTTTALDKRLISLSGREREKIKNSSFVKFTQKEFFQQYGLCGWIFCSHKNSQCALFSLSVLFLRYIQKQVKQFSKDVTKKMLDILRCI